MIMSPIRTLISALLLLCVSISSTAAQRVKCTLNDPVDLEGDYSVMVQSVLNRQDLSFTMRITFTQGNAWIGVAVNTDNDKLGWMAPAVGVIGRMLDDGSPSVARYDLINENSDGSGVMMLPEDGQTLQNAIFYQPDEDTTVLEFTQQLRDDYLQIRPSSTWIYGIGRPDNEWEGRHPYYGSFTLVLEENCEEIKEEGTEPTTSATEAEVTEAGEAATDGTGPTTETEPTKTVPTETEPTRATDAEPTETWVEAATNQTEYGSANATEIDIVEDEEVQEEVEIIEEGEAEEEKDDEKEKEEGKGKEVDVTDAKEDTDHYADAASEFVMAAATSENGGITINSKDKPTKGLWVAHGWVMAIAWGLLAPLAVGCAVIRRFAAWYKLHLLLNCLVAVMTVIGFTLAVVATAKDGDVHFAQETHQQVGLTIVILLVVQAVAGILRPGLPAKQISQQPKDSEEGEVVKEEGSNGTNSSGDSEDGGAPVEVENDNDDEEGDYYEEKSIQRVIWELLHRAMGMFVLGAAWYNCASGYELIAGAFGSEQDHSAVFWGFAGGIGGLIFLVAYIIRI